MLRYPMSGSIDAGTTIQPRLNRKTQVVRSRLYVLFPSEEAAQTV
jgi:hypothetical protein